MAHVSCDEAGNVTIRCSAEEALAVEVALRPLHSDEHVNVHIHGVWDGLDDLRQELLQSKLPFAHTLWRNRGES